MNPALQKRQPWAHPLDTSIRKVLPNVVSRVNSVLVVEKSERSLMRIFCIVFGTSSIGSNAERVPFS